VFNKNEVKEKIIILLFNKFLIKEIKRWPAIILAERRIERVIGRIKLLIVSIITIKGLKAKGVLRGTRWVNICAVFLVQPLIINLSQNGIAKERETDKWLVGVKIKGKSLKKLRKEIIVKKVKKIIKFLKCDFFKLLFISEII